MVNEVNDNNDSRKILAVIVMIGVLMFSISGATFAYLAVAANSVNTITGNVASVSLSFQNGTSTANSGVPTLVKPTSTYASNPLVPQYGYNSGNILQNAIANNCVDGNGNVVCRVYTFTIRNNSTASVSLKGRIYFSGIANMSNLRWALMSDADTVSLTANTTAGGVRTPQLASNCTESTATTGATANNCWFETNKSLVPSGGASVTAATGSYQQYWIVLWINETGNAQTDTGTFAASIAFTSSDGSGLTSTITTAS